MAAAARPPGIGDGRVPCPLCGGLIHPVAGRCKHCKEDLTAFRAGRPQAAAQLPALNGHVAATAVPVAAAVVAPIAIPAREGSQPILPQRTTGRHSAQRPRGSLLRNWPLIVIVLAVLAIVAAVVIMVLPSDNGSKGGKRQLMPAPAPDRMETNPLPNKQSQIDPWGAPDDNYAPAPPQPAPRRMPDPPQPSPDPNDPDDIYGGLSGGSLGGSLGGLSNSFMLTMFHQACTKLQSCPNADTMITTVCNQFSAMPRPAAPQNCPIGDRCLEEIEKLDCDMTAQSGSPLGAVYLIQSCMKAATEC